ncbi:hypothetical protein, partial [Bacteroides caecimuris]|uniref:hypothetical protein n=1 Tax=Bacteroides caecimuris TaxID=1796613 RepID=UPI0025731EBC
NSLYCHLAPRLLTTPSRASERIYYSTASLSPKSDGDLSIYFSVRATGNMDVIGASRIEVQRNAIGGWVTEYTFTPSNAPEIQAENKFQHSAILTYSPLFVGKEYRTVVTIYVKNTSGSSTKQLASKTIVS